MPEWLKIGLWVLGGAVGFIILIILYFVFWVEEQHAEGKNPFE